MFQVISLKKAERKVFRSSFQDGLWEILISCFPLQFAIAPLLSEIGFGDFWSSAVFLPVWAIVYFAIRMIRKYVVTPRIGVVKFGIPRKTKLFKFNKIIFMVLLVGFFLGILSAMNFNGPGWIHMASFGFILLVCFSIAANFLDFPLLYLYGVLITLSLPIGEVLYVHAGARNHGYPITFGITAGIIMLIGLTKFIRLLRNCPVSDIEPALKEQ